MNDPDALQHLGRLEGLIQSLTKSVEKLDRSVTGDSDSGTPSLRAAVKGVADDLQREVTKLKAELDSVDDALCDRVDALEQTHAIQAARQEGMYTVIKWLGGGSLLMALGVIAALIKLVGGH
ncbi:hypothetical protein DKM44_12775 [Deinococcus irradiatisoli]|uniref:DUF1515 domain-containing protein n=1 Tax=Deinococcus irradiatisoli TaxID=2202254 RepID=A0A2Z3JG87_9DEIO|nr:hypothetical protein [Deinococcus irradiatisoli]AWN23995.1 hypothetical protein DKM44_12775 [Deinococcus irradiatisoli]